MLPQSLARLPNWKAIAAGAIVAVGTAFAAAGPAHAGSLSIDLYLGGPNPLGVHYRGGHRGHGFVHHGPPRRFAPHPRRRVCSPRRAVRKAYRMGLNHPYVHRIGKRRIVVRGNNWGYPAKVVFGRGGRCPVIKTVNLRW